ncbi:MAG: cytochrome c oxidase subunit II [Acidimicrobiales bacterium]|jgi:cytochrome c oxidase subunit 2
MADSPKPPAEEHHFRRMFVIWVVLALIVDLLYYFLVGPHVPPGKMTSTAGGAQFDFNVLIVVALPVMIAVWVYLGYALSTWRASRGGPDPVVGPNSRGHLPTQIAWIGGTTVIVLGLFVFGTVQLIVPAGAGGGEGPTPIWTPTSHNTLVVQVIAQQWKFTYRYPSFGGMETTQLVLPADTNVAFHVTSLDVIHDFWAYQLGVKADANPGQDNVAFTTTQQLGSFTVRCDELCGLWHGAMYNDGVVLPKSAFETWADTTKAQLARNTKFLPPFAWSYTPDANGSDGGYYPDTVDPYSNVEVYGAQKVKI